MGLGYSDLHVYFYSKKTENYNGTGYNVTVKQENYPGCSNYVMFTHKIVFNKDFDGRNYNVILYDGSDQKSEGNPVFGYYYPKDNNQVVESVSTYYSVLDLNFPLAVTFKCGGNFYNCDLGKLTNAGWDRAHKITEYTFHKSFNKNILDEIYRKQSRNRKIRFRIGKEKVDMYGGKQELGNNKNYRFIFTPKGNESVLDSDYLFAIDFFTNEPICPNDPNPKNPEYCRRAIVEEFCNQYKYGHRCRIAAEKNLCKNFKDKKKCEGPLKKKICRSNSESCQSHIKKLFIDEEETVEIKHTNKIDEYFLRPFNNQLYDGIMVYFDRDKKQPPERKCKQNEDNNNTALLVEFIDSCNSKTYLKRMDSNGHWWAQVLLNYNDDKSLHSQLEKIKEEYKNDVVTVILDKKVTYLGVEKVDPTTANGYNKYTYVFSNPNPPNLLFERIQLLDAPLGKLTEKAKQVEVYYLKASGKEDKEPFLIVIDPDGNPEKKKNECYHFIGNYNFKDWVKFKCMADGKAIVDEKLLVKKLYERVTKIDTSVSCITDIRTVRWYAHQILIGEDPTITKPKDDPKPTKPKIEEPKPPPEELPVWLIVGCVAAGVVLIVTSVVVYGIYWYNTTIKLLT